MTNQQGPAFKFDIRFQVKILATGMKDEDSLRSMVSVVEPEYFTMPILASAWRILRHVMMKDMVVLSPETLIMMLQKVHDYPAEQLNNLREGLEAVTMEDKSIVVASVQEFCKQAAFQIVLANSLDKIERGDFDTLYKQLNDLYAKDWGHTDMGMDYFKDIGARFIDGSDTRSRRGIVPTGLELDEYTGGGLAQRELGLIIGPTGRGKSAMFLNMAYHAIINGKNVLYLSNELSREEVSARMDKVVMAGLKGLEEFLTLDLISTLRELHNSAGARFDIKDFPAGELTVPMLGSFYRTLLASGKKYDVVFLDYIGEMKLGAADREDIKYKELVTQLRGLAYKMDIPIWTGHQAITGSHDKPILRQDDIADARSMLRVPDIAFSMGADYVEFAAGYQRLTLLKNRFGPTDITRLVKFHGPTFRFTRCNDPAQMTRDVAKKEKELIQETAASIR